MTRPTVNLNYRQQPIDCQIREEEAGEISVNLHTALSDFRSAATSRRTPQFFRKCKLNIIADKCAWPLKSPQKTRLHRERLP